jgi:hypothetical protein
MAARAKYDPAQFVDVQYEDFTADPIGTVESIYRHFGLHLSDEARTAMTAVHEHSRSSERRPSHMYSLAEFGLTGEEVDARFAAYRAAHRP